MIKVLHVGAKNYPPAHGGTERVVYNIVNSIQSVDFYLLVEWDQVQTDRIFVLPNNLNYASKTKFILNFARRHHIDIIHFHNEKYIPMAIYFSVVFKKVVLTVHGVHFRSPKFSWFHRAVFFIVDTLGTIVLPRMVHCSEYDQKEFAKYIPFRKTYFVNNGTNISPSPQTPVDILYKDTYVYVGRITPAKNVLKLIDSADAKGIKVHIYGMLDKQCPDYCNQVLSRIEQSKYIEYKGVAPYNQLFEIMKKYAAFLYITIMEGLPLAVLEAASCGMYLILSDIPQYNFFNITSVTYVKVYDLLIPYPSEISKGAINRDYIINNFSNEHMGREYLKVYESLLKQKA